MDAPAIADREAADLDRLGQRRALRGREHALVDRQVQAQLGQALAERRDVFELRDLGVHALVDSRGSGDRS